MGVRLRGQGVCELRSEAFVKIQKKFFFFFFFFFGGGGEGSGWGVAFVKIQKKMGGGGLGSGGGVGLAGIRVDGNREVKLV